MVKNLKKIMAVALACATVIGMSATVFAASPEGGVQHTGGDLNISKTLVVTNPTLSSVDGPGLKYDYTIASETPSAANGGTAATDSNGNSSTVYAGPTGGATLTTSSVEWPKGTAVNASSSGVENTKNIVVSADATKFSSPGVYRYKITEAATPANPSTIGVTDTNPAEVRYLDVFVENDTTGFKISGYVVHNGTKPSGKGTFDNSQFDTKNVEVKKSTTGSMADKANQFPFSAAVSDNGRYYYDGKGTAASAATNKNEGTSSSTTLCNNESFWICGVSTVGTVNVTETNNTSDTYSTAISGLATSAASDVAAGQTKASGSTTVGNGGQMLFTNTLDSVSPTGVAMKYAPGIGLVLIAGFLFIFATRRKKA